MGGGGSPVQAALQPVAGVAEGRSQGGVSSGQVETTNFKLEKIYLQLYELNGGRKAPEAANQRVEQGSTLDGAGIGWGGG